MALIDRLSALCDQTAFTGIDFIQVVEPLVQDRLRVFFVVEPTQLDAPMIPAASLTDPLAGSPIGSAGPGVTATLNVTITSQESGAVVEIDSLEWLVVVAPAGNRVALEIVVSSPGDFSLHRLHIDDARVDPFFNDTEFSFKQGCPSVFDCRTDCSPAAIESQDYPVDYLARDFWSFRRALLDFAAERYPGWSEPLEADEAVMLMEIMAALGDEFAYTQDRYARETTLPNATQRRSRSALARLVDYLPEPGLAAETELAIWVRAGVGGETCDIGARAWALPEGREPIPFSATAEVWHHEAWNEIPLHCPDSDVACLPAGATEAYLLTSAPTVAQLPPGSPLTPQQFWQGRRMILASRPADPSEPQRALAVTLTSVEATTDSLAPTPGVATPVAKITWDTPTPWPMPLAETSALLNIVTVIAGEEISERFRIGADNAASTRHPGLTPTELGHLLALPRTVEREGPHEQDREGRGRILRYGLRNTEQRGLGWIKPAEASGLSNMAVRLPLLELNEVLPPLYDPDPGGAAWSFTRDLATADLDSTEFTLEEGMWRKVVTYQTPTAGDIEFQDYAGDEGWTIRFGDGAFGRPPEDGTVLEAVYFSAPGSAANLSPTSVIHLNAPANAAPGLLFDYAEAVTNPLQITSGSDEEAAENIRINAPEAYRALPLRAVRPEDFSDILERIDWVQRANATVRWTGSWASYFIAADPTGGFALSNTQLQQLDAEIDCIRQATRDARAAEPDYVDIDLQVEICASIDSYPGEVAERVTRALATPGYFNPDNFTFGQSLSRSGLEAAIQCVPGVKGVEKIRLRERTKRDWHDFAESELMVEPWQIVRLQNDPRFPGRGSLSITAHGGAS